MDERTVIKLGLILAAYSRVLGMQALNMQRAAVGSSMGYQDEPFFAEAEIIEKVVREP